MNFELGDLIKLKSIENKVIFKVINKYLPYETELYDYNHYDIEVVIGGGSFCIGEKFRKINPKDFIIYKKVFKEFKKDKIDIIINNKKIAIIKEGICVELDLKDEIKEVVKDEDGEINLTDFEIDFIKECLK